MKTQDSRRFGIAEGLILIGGVAAGLGSFQALAPNQTPKFIWEAFVHLAERFIGVYLLGGVLAGSGVLWSWVTLRLCGVCRVHPTWTDRLGRLTGAAWVAIGATSAVYFLLTT